MKLIKTAVSIHGKPQIVNADTGSLFIYDVYTNYLKIMIFLSAWMGKGVFPPVMMKMYEFK
ncbi:hypothetical protein LJC53_02095 [Bacteroidales bacterium OttesenSCG-928-C03]|nr:hypothetical protein [Bacteroidales bacterium OttesenSCG-928-C03]